MREVRAVPGWFAKDGGYVDAVDAGRIERGTISGGFGIGGGAFAGDEPDFDLWAGADCAGASAIGIETFSGGGGCTRPKGNVPQRDLFFGECAGGRTAQSWNSALKRRKDRNTEVTETRTQRAQRRNGVEVI